MREQEAYDVAGTGARTAQGAGAGVAGGTPGPSAGGAHRWRRAGRVGRRARRAWGWAVGALALCGALGTAQVVLQAESGAERVARVTRLAAQSDAAATSLGVATLGTAYLQVPTAEPTASASWQALGRLDQGIDPARSTGTLYPLRKGIEQLAGVLIFPLLIASVLHALLVHRGEADSRLRDLGINFFVVATMLWIYPVWDWMLYRQTAMPLAQTMSNGAIVREVAGRIGDAAGGGGQRAAYQASVSSGFSPSGELSAFWQNDLACSVEIAAAKASDADAGRRCADPSVPVTRQVTHARSAQSIALGSAAQKDSAMSQKPSWWKDMWERGMQWGRDAASSVNTVMTYDLGAWIEGNIGNWLAESIGGILLTLQSAIAAAILWFVWLAVIVGRAMSLSLAPIAIVWGLMPGSNAWAKPKKWFVKHAELSLMPVGVAFGLLVYWAVMTAIMATPMMTDVLIGIALKIALFIGFVFSAFKTANLTNMLAGDIAEVAADFGKSARNAGIAVAGTAAALTVGVAGGGAMARVAASSALARGGSGGAGAGAPGGSVRLSGASTPGARMANQAARMRSAAAGAGTAAGGGGGTGAGAGSAGSGARGTGAGGGNGAPQGSGALARVRAALGRSNGPGTASAGAAGRPSGSGPNGGPASGAAGSGAAGSGAAGSGGAGSGRSANPGPGGAGSAAGGATSGANGGAGGGARSGARSAGPAGGGLGSANGGGVPAGTAGGRPGTGPARSGGQGGTAGRLRALWQRGRSVMVEAVMNDMALLRWMWEHRVTMSQVEAATNGNVGALMSATIVEPIRRARRDWQQLRDIQRRQRLQAARAQVMAAQLRRAAGAQPGGGTTGGGTAPGRPGTATPGAGGNATVQPGSRGGAGSVAPSGPSGTGSTSTPAGGATTNGAPAGASSTAGAGGGTTAPAGGAGTAPVGPTTSPSGSTQAAGGATPAGGTSAPSTAPASTTPASTTPASGAGVGSSGTTGRVPAAPAAPATTTAPSGPVSGTGGGAPTVRATVRAPVPPPAAPARATRTQQVIAAAGVAPDSAEAVTLATLPPALTRPMRDESVEAYGERLRETSSEVLRAAWYEQASAAERAAAGLPVQGGVGEARGTAAIDVSRYQGAGSLARLSGAERDALTRAIADYTAERAEVVQRVAYVRGRRYGVLLERYVRTLGAEQRYDFQQGSLFEQVIEEMPELASRQADAYAEARRRAEGLVADALAAARASGDTSRLAELEAEVQERIFLNAVTIAEVRERERG